MVRLIIMFCNGFRGGVRGFFSGSAAVAAGLANVQRCSGDMRRTLCTLHRLHVLQYVLCMRMLRYVACVVRVVQFRHARTARVICPRNHFATLPIYMWPLPSVQVCYLLCPWAPLKGPLHIVQRRELNPYPRRKIEFLTATR